ncbi:MAG: polymer-forming cytoskeletal protein [Butyrivibrio sp.]|nr:polymer-forming cytoskeletal protein [Butyrivibrio sp.]
MFGKKELTTDPALEQVGTIIGPGAIIDGPISTKDSTRIDGVIKGNVTISGALIVGEEGKITGTVSALNVYIAGEVTGNISAPQGKIEISDTGKVVGDITCKGIVIDENAVFQGRCDMPGVEKTPAEIAKEKAAANKEAVSEETALEKSTDSSSATEAG